MTLTCWGITDGSAGMVSQVMGLTQALGFSTILKVCKRSPLVTWAPGNWFTHAPYLRSESDPLSPPWPDVVVTCGRRSIPLGLHIKRQTGGKAFLVCIQDPRIDPKYFDLVVAMDHDRITGPNVVKVAMALQHLTPQKLELAREKYAPVFASLPKPLCAVMIGGPTHRSPFSDGDMEQLLSDLKLLLETFPGSLLITPSRRTRHEHVTMMRQAFPDNSRVFLADLAQDNPYFGFLALADYFIVTNDSVSMMTEACATGKTVYTYALPGHKTSKAKTFSCKLHGLGLAQDFQGNLIPNPQPFVDETAQVARLILDRISEQKKNAQ